MKKKQPKVSYGPGRVPHYGSPESLAKVLDKKVREQEKAKEGKGQAVDSMGTPIPSEVQNTAARWVGRRVLICGDHPHAGKAGTVDRVEMARAIRRWGFVVKLDDYAECFVFDGSQWRAI